MARTLHLRRIQLPAHIHRSTDCQPSRRSNRRGALSGPCNQARDEHRAGTRKPRGDSCSCGAFRCSRHGDRRDHAGISACCRLVDLVEAPQDIPFLGGLIQREIIYRIRQGSEGARLRAIATSGDHSQCTAKAIAWIKTNYAKTLPVEDLAHIAAMSVSTFHHTSAC